MEKQQLLTKLKKMVRESNLTHPVQYYIENNEPFYWNVSVYNLFERGKLIYESGPLSTKEDIIKYIESLKYDIFDPNLWLNVYIRGFSRETLEKQIKILGNNIKDKNNKLKELKNFYGTF